MARVIQGPDISRLSRNADNAYSVILKKDQDDSSQIACRDLIKNYLKTYPILINAEVWWLVTSSSMVA